MDISERIRRLRGEQTREQFSKITGIAPQTLYKYESRTGKVSLESVEMISKSLNVRYEWLVFGRGPTCYGEEVTSPEKCEVTPTTVALCARCVTLEQKLLKKLESFDEERRELTAELRHLWKENSELREKCARLEERQYQRSISHDGGEAVG